MDLKEQNEKHEGLVHYLEDEKSRLQDKVDRMLADGRLHPLVVGRSPCRSSLPLTQTFLSSALQRKRPGAGVGVHAGKIRRVQTGTLSVTPGCVCQEFRGREGFLPTGGRALQERLRFR